MEAISSPLQSPTIPSSLTNHQRPTRTRLHLPTKQSCTQRSQLTSPIRAHPLHNALSVVADTTASSGGGDISVLLPISAVLFFVYWIANFVVPGMITDDLMKKDSDGEEAMSRQANISETEKANTSSSQRQKIKKDDLKKMINRR